MAWSTPPTLTDGQVLTGAHTQIWRDDLNATAPGVATTAGRLIVTTGPNAVTERALVTNSTSATESTTSTSFTDLATVGPTVTVTTGARALVIVTCTLNNNTVGAFAQAGYDVTSATVLAASFDRCIQLRAASVNQEARCSSAHLEIGLNSGSNIFTMKYAMSSGGGTATFFSRRIIVLGL